MEFLLENSQERKRRKQHAGQRKRHKGQSHTLTYDISKGKITTPKIQRQMLGSGAGFTLKQEINHFDTGVEHPRGQYKSSVNIQRSQTVFKPLRRAPHTNAYQAYKDEAREVNIFIRRVKGSSLAFTRKDMLETNNFKLTT